MLDVTELVDWLIQLNHKWTFLEVRVEEILERAVEMLMIVKGNSRET